MEWDLEESITGNAIDDGDFFFSTGNETATLELCLEEGCYRFRVEADDDIFQDYIDIIITDSDGNIIPPNEVVEWGDDKVRYFFGVLDGCSGAGDCMADFTVTETSIPGVISINNASISETPATYNWTWPDGETSTAEDPNIVFSQNGIYEICLILSAECVSTICQQVAVTGFLSIDCPDTLQAAELQCGTWLFVAGPEEGANVSWDFGDGNSSGGNVSMTHTFTEPGTYNVCATYTTDNCDVVLCKEIVVTSCGDNSACPGEMEAEIVTCELFEFEIESATEGSVIWMFGDDSLDYGGNIIAHTYNAPGEYIACAFFSSSTCEDGFTLCVPVIVDDCGSPACAITLEQETTDGQTFSLDADTELPHDSLVWDMGDGNVLAGNDQYDYTYTENGNYLICVSSPPTADCPEGSSVCVTVTVTGASTSVFEKENAGFDIFPNPAQSDLNVKSTDIIMHLEIRDVMGRKMLTQNNLGKSVIDISDIPGGIYFLSVTTEKGTLTKQLQIIH